MQLESFMSLAPLQSLSLLSEQLVSAASYGLSSLASLPQQFKFPPLLVHVKPLVVHVFWQLSLANPSSAFPSQLSSIPLQTSASPGFIAALLSSQSVLSAT